jgi:streptomycin 6-kinase
MTEVPGIAIPSPFGRGIRAESGSAGQAWLEELPDMVDRLCGEWGLTRDGDPMHGYLALVLPVRTEGSRYVLKLAQSGELVSHEAKALGAWAGRGAVELHRVDLNRGAMLLERLDSRTTLNSVAIGDAVETAASLLRELAIAPPEGIPTLEDKMVPLRESLPREFDDLNRPFPHAWLVRALDMCDELLSDLGEVLVDEDLHFGNVLRGDRQRWNVIDPKVVIGDLEYGVAAMFWNRHGEDAPLARLAAIAQAAQLDVERAKAWLFVRVIEMWLWAVPLGFTGYASVCSELASWLVGSAGA